MGKSWFYKRSWKSVKDPDEKCLFNQIGFLRLFIYAIADLKKILTYFPDLFFHGGHKLSKRRGHQAENQAQSLRQRLSG
jgi:hypothetical protein